MTESSEHPVHRAARMLAEWAYTDSMVRLDRATLRDLLADDSSLSGYLPTDEQCAAFIMGEGDTGTIPAQLVADFPSVHAYLETWWQ